MSRPATSGPLLSGLDRLLRNPALLGSYRGRRIGLLAHAASVTRDLDHAIDALRDAGLDVVRLFGPEHGLRGEAQMMEAINSAIDPLSGLPVVSLYGADATSLKPTPDQIADLDALFVDVQDVGSRYYTYACSAMLVAEVCLDAGVPVVVLDRPNPLGARLEGPALEPGFESFVGMIPLPTRHGLTVGEYLRFAFAGRDLDEASLTVIPCDGYSPTAYLDECDYRWALPSPNMPSVATAVVYPGQCLLEATTISEGRGTTRPFELFGAPWIEARRLRQELQRLPLPGVAWREVSFIPTFDKFVGERCEGLQIHVTDRASYLPVLTSAVLITTVRRLFPASFGWRPGAYEFVRDIPAIDLLGGSPRLRELIEREASLDELAAWSRTPAETAQRCAAARLPAYG